MTANADSTIKILLVEDSEDDAVLVRSAIRDIAFEGFTLDWRDDYHGGITAVRQGCYDVVLLDYLLPGGTGIELLEETKDLASKPAIILMTGQGNRSVDIEAMKLGAADYLVKDNLNPDLLERAIRYAVDRRSSEQALRASQAKYQAFVDNTTEGIWRFETAPPIPIYLPPEEQIDLLARTARIAECNNAMTSIYGCDSVSDMIGASLGEFLPTVRSSDGNWLEAFVKNGYRLHAARTFLTDRKGRRKCVLVNLVGQTYDGQLHLIWGSQVDITPQQQAEAVLAQLSAIVEQSDDAIYSETADGLVLTWNHAARALYGYAAEEIIGKPSSLLVPPDRQAETNRIYERIRSEERTAKFETTHVQRSGERIDVSISISRMSHSRRPNAGFSSIVRDVTEAKRVESRIREREANMAVAQQISHIGSWEFTHVNGSTLASGSLWWSDQTFRLHGVDPATFIPSNASAMERVHADDRAAVMEAFTESLSSRTNFSLDYRILMDDGSIKHVHARCQTFFDHDGTPTRSVGTTQDITERKTAEQERDRIEAALRQNESRFRAVLDTTDCLLIHDVDGRMVEANQDACDSLGYTRDELIRMHVTDFALEYEECGLAAMWQSLVSGKESKATVVGRHRRKDGTIFPVEVRVGTMVQEDAPLIVAAARNITERMHLQEDINLRDRTIQASSNGVAIVDIRRPDQPLVYVNPAFEKITGYSSSEVLSRNCRFLQGRDTSQSELAKIRDAVKSGAAAQVVLRNYRKDGTFFWNELAISPVHDAEGLLTHFVGIQNDVTARIEAEEERDRFFTLSLDLLAICGKDGYFRRLNPAFESTLGFSKETLMSRPFFDFIHPDDIESTLKSMENLDRDSKVDAFENRYLCSNGSYRWLRWTSASFEGVYYTVAHDVTSAKEAEALLRLSNEVLEVRVAERTAQLDRSYREMITAKEEAERANATKSDFLSRMSHELRTPLNSILGFAQLMEMDSPSERQAKRIKHIISGGDHLLNLINEILDLARIESGHLKVSPEPVGMVDCVVKAMDLIRPLCDQRKQHLMFDSGGCGSLCVFVDPQRLTQVLINLLANAVKYNRDGGEVAVSCGQSRTGWNDITVADTGIGIAADGIEKLFQPFERLDADKTSAQGTGLGLALSKRLLEQMGGTISVESVLGKGTAFTIELPCYDQSDPRADHLTHA